MKKFTMRTLALRLPAILVLSGFAAGLQAQPVQAPPLPPGSDKVQVEPGVSPQEAARQKRAHSHSRLGKKNPTRDDTATAPPAAAPGSNNADPNSAVSPSR